MGTSNWSKEMGLISGFCLNIVMFVGLMTGQGRYQVLGLLALFFAVTQLIWMIPLEIVAYKINQEDYRAGVTQAIMATFCLNFVIVFLLLTQLHPSFGD